jgi:hypothetical protein
MMSSPINPKKISVHDWRKRNTSRPHAYLHWQFGPSDQHLSPIRTDFRAHIHRQHDSQNEKRQYSHHNVPRKKPLGLKPRILHQSVDHRIYRVHSLFAPTSDCVLPSTIRARADLLENLRDALLAIDMSTRQHSRQPTFTSRIAGPNKTSPTNTTFIQISRN